MELLDFKSHSLTFNLAVLAAAAVVVWLAGTRLARYAAAIAKITGVGQAVIGMLLLGCVTSLPEIAIAITASLENNAGLTVNNLLGAVAPQVTLLAIADALIGRGDALTHVVANPGVLLQGTMAILLLTLVAAGVLIGDRSLFGIGVWCWGLLFMYVIAVRVIARAPSAWMPLDASAHPVSESEALDTGEGVQHGRDTRDDPADAAAQQPLRRAISKTILVGTIILAAGFLLSRTADAVADKTGLGANFVGAVLLAFCTSLPEISTVFASVRMRRYVMAVSEIFGSCLFTVALVFFVDAVYQGGPVLNEIGRFSGFAALLTIVLITLYVAGFIERRNRIVLRMGVDSLAVLVVYVGGLIVLYQLR